MVPPKLFGYMYYFQKWSHQHSKYQLTLQYVADKTATCTPESLAFYFNSVVNYPTTMQVSKLSRYIK